MDERTPLGTVAPRRLDADAERLELALAPMPELVVAEGGQEQALARQPGELNRRDGSASRRLLPGVARVDDLARGRHPLDSGELDPLHMPDDGDPHLAGS
jgi:hypothetical protein